MQFPLEDALSISQRLRLPNDLVDCLPAAKKLKEDLPSLMEASPSQLTARLEQAPLATLYALSLFNLPADACQKIDQYLTTWRKIWPVTTGNDLLRMGIQPGPHVSRNFELSTKSLVRWQNYHL